MSKKILSVFALVLVLVMSVTSALACTTYGIGKDVMADGSTVITHTCDSTGDDFRMWIIPPMEGGPDVKRDIVLDGNLWGDWSDYPNTKDYGGGTVVGEMPQPEDTYQYLHTNYSVINEYGVAMGESTCSIARDDDRALKAYEVMIESSTGIIDCYQAQHIALERAQTAREAVEIIGSLIDEYGWYGYAENINICDGNEVWIMECYGQNVWCAVKIPDNGFFVCANRARIDAIDFEDTENYMWSENIKTFAIENELWSEESGDPFNPSYIFAPNGRPYSFRREWRALSLVAPSLNLDPEAGTYPLYVIPERELTVEDIRLLNSDHYDDTPYDVTRTAMAGPYGNLLNEYNAERTISMYRATYHTIATVRADLPREVGSLVYVGWGAPASSYMVPLWPSMTKLPPQLCTGSRYGKYDRDSSWWVSSFVQQTATQNYENAIKEIYAARDPKMAEQYKTVATMQAAATALVEAGDRDGAIALLTNYAYNNAIDWHNYWLEFGDELYGTYMFNRIDMQASPYPQWWTDIMNEAPLRPVEEEAEEASK